MDALKSGREPDLSAPLGVTTEINLHAPALLPENYCSDIHERLVLYKRLANCASETDLEAMQEELIDRFGLPPDQTLALLACHRLRLVARPLVGLVRENREGFLQAETGEEQVHLAVELRPIQTQERGS